MKISDKYKAWLLASLMSVICLIAGVVVYIPINWGDDYAQYISQAQAILDGSVDEFVSDNGFIINNSSNLLGAITYPWGFPCILAFMMRLGLDSVFAFHMMEVMCIVGAGLILFWIGLDITGKISGGGTTSAFVLLNIVLIKYSAVIATDVCYPFFVMAGLGISYILYYKEKEYNYPSFQRNILLMLLGVHIFMATAVRDGGIVLLIAVVLQQIINWIKNNDVAKLSYQVSEIALLQLAYWIPRMTFERVLPLFQESHYDMLETASFQRLIQNMIGYIKCFWEIYPFHKMISTALLVITMCMVIVGVIATSKDLFLLPLLYAIGTFGLYCIWPVFIGIRFGFSAFMALLIYVPFGIKYIRTKHADYKMLSASCLAVAVSVVTILGGTELAYIVKYSIIPPQINSGPYTHDAEELFEFINSSTQENEIIVFQKPRALYLNTGRLGMQVDLKDFNEKLPKADYVVDGIEADLGDYNEETLIQYDSEDDNIDLVSVFENDMFKMYKIEKRK